jgi:hypothetical protein
MIRARLRFPGSSRHGHKEARGCAKRAPTRPARTLVCVQKCFRFALAACEMILNVTLAKSDQENYLGESARVKSCVRVPVTV